ncbi:MAG: putative toxin-antitoxin system toxin component, PIN family, partial [Gemmataceae bacterium]
MLPGRFDLLISAEQLDELRRVTRYTKLRERLSPALAGRLTNELRSRAEMVPNLPTTAVSPDPGDDYLLATAAAGHADFLVTGDKRGCWHSRLTRASGSSPSARSWSCI